MNLDTFLFDEIVPPETICTSTRDDAAPALTLESLREMMAKLPPGPTEEQRRWARDNGFPGYPGFKLGTAAYAMFKQTCVLDQACVRNALENVPRTASGEPMLYVIPVVIDRSLPPDAILSAEDAWAMTQGKTT